MTIVRPVIYSTIGWTPQEFYKCTPAEVNEALKGADVKWKREMIVAAWKTHYVLAAQVKRPPKIEKLYEQLVGKKKKAATKAMTAQALRKALGIKGGGPKVEEQRAYLKKKFEMQERQRIRQEQIEEMENG